MMHSGPQTRSPTACYSQSLRFSIPNIRPNTFFFRNTVLLSLRPFINQDIPYHELFLRCTVTVQMSEETETARAVVKDAVNQVVRVGPTAIE
jgi:hypothetical protein